MAAGIDGLFIEVHEAPERALSDGPNALRLEALETVVAEAAGAGCVRKGGRVSSTPDGL